MNVGRQRRGLSVIVVVVVRWQLIAQDEVAEKL